jgi:acyl-CoA dehydrogenase
MSESSLTITAEEISDLIADIMELYPDEYWRRVDRERDYPEQFVQELTNAELLSSLIPEEYGGTFQLR